MDMDFGGDFDMGGGDFDMGDGDFGAGDFDAGGGDFDAGGDFESADSSFDTADTLLDTSNDFSENEIDNNGFEVDVSSDATDTGEPNSDVTIDSGLDFSSDVLLSDTDTGLSDDGLGQDDGLDGINFTDLDTDGFSAQEETSSGDFQQTFENGDSDTNGSLGAGEILGVEGGAIDDGTDSNPTSSDETDLLGVDLSSDGDTDQGIDMDSIPTDGDGIDLLGTDLGSDVDQDAGMASSTTGDAGSDFLGADLNGDRDADQDATPDSSPASTYGTDALSPDLNGDGETNLGAGMDSSPTDGDETDALISSDLNGDGETDQDTDMSVPSEGDGTDALGADLNGDSYVDQGVGMNSSPIGVDGNDVFGVYLNGDVDQDVVVDSNPGRGDGTDVFGADLNGDGDKSGSAPSEGDKGDSVSGEGGRDDNVSGEGDKGGISPGGIGNEDNSALLGIVNDPQQNNNSVDDVDTKLPKLVYVGNDPDLVSSSNEEKEREYRIGSPHDDWEDYKNIVDGERRYEVGTDALTSKTLDDALITLAKSRLENTDFTGADDYFYKKYGHAPYTDAYPQPQSVDDANSQLGNVDDSDAGNQSGNTSHDSGTELSQSGKDDTAAGNTDLNGGGELNQEASVVSNSFKSDDTNGSQAVLSDASAVDIAQQNKTDIEESESTVKDSQENMAPVQIQPNEEVKLDELKPDTLYERNGYYFRTDELGRPVGVYGKLELIDGTRSDEQTKIGRLGLEDDEGGHLIGTRFNGPADAFNLVPQNFNLNRGAWKSMENDWASAIKGGYDVTIEIIPMYNDDSRRPNLFTVNYTYTNKETGESLPAGTMLFFNQSNKE